MVLVGRGSLIRSTNEFPGIMEIFILIWVMVTQMYVFVKINRTVLLRSGHFTVGLNYISTKEKMQKQTQKKTHIGSQPKKCACQVSPSSLESIPSVCLWELSLAKTPVLKAWSPNQQQHHLGSCRDANSQTHPDQLKTESLGVGLRSLSVTSPWDCNEAQGRAG